MSKSRELDRLSRLALEGDDEARLELQRLKTRKGVYDIEEGIYAFVFDDERTEDVLLTLLGIEKGVWDKWWGYRIRYPEMRNQELSIKVKCGIGSGELIIEADPRFHSCISSWLRSEAARLSQPPPRPPTPFWEELWGLLTYSFNQLMEYIVRQVWSFIST